MRRREANITVRFPAAIEEHVAVTSRALSELNVNPDYLLWHYVRGAIVRHGSISEAARQLSMHRRTLQRIIMKKCPPEHPLP